MRVTTDLCYVWLWSDYNMIVHSDSPCVRDVNEYIVRPKEAIECIVYRLVPVGLEQTSYIFSI